MLHLGQRQVGLLNKPACHLSSHLGISVGLAPWPVRNALWLTSSVAGSRNLLRPADAHNEATRQFLKRSLALIVSKQQLTAQIISKGFPHVRFRRGKSPEITVYTIS
jgi:hypothetical protein